MGAGPPLLRFAFSLPWASLSPCPAPRPHSFAPACPQTHSRASRVMIMRMGRRFMPPTQLLLHMKLYKMVVNSVPTYGRGRRGGLQGQHAGSNPWRGTPGPGGTQEAHVLPLGRRGTVVWGRRFLLCGPLPSTPHPPSIHSWGTLSATHHAGLGRPTGCGLLAPATSPTRLGVKPWDWVWAHAQVSVGTAGFCMPWAPLGRGALPWGREEPNLAHVHVSGACGALTHEPRTPAPWESRDHRMNSCHVLPGSGYK